MSSLEDDEIVINSVRMFAEADSKLYSLYSDNCPILLCISADFACILLSLCIHSHVIKVLMYVEFSAMNWSLEITDTVIYIFLIFLSATLG